MKRLFQQLQENIDLKNEMTAFNDYFKNPKWILFPELPSKTADMSGSKLADCVNREISSKVEARRTLTKILKAVKASGVTEAVEKFRYGKKHGFCYPLIFEGDLFGCMVVCDLKRSISREISGLFAAFTETVIHESRKEIELEDINRTVRPRAIALSTVHTVHRLMTSTLDLNELLPKIARLSLQVIRANRCSIKLVDKKRKSLLPKTTIDLRKAKTKLKKVEIGRYAPGRAVKKGGPVRGSKYLAVPMIDEDVVGVITLYDKIGGGNFTQFDEEIMKTMAEQSAIAIKNAQLFKEQSDVTFNSIKCIAQLLENRPHGSRRAEASFLKLSYLIGRKFKMNESEIKMLQYAAMLHDAGQISVPERVLMKRGELTGREFDIVKMHLMKGAAILSKLKPLKPIVPIIMYHHENFNGSGYPKRLKGQDIPLSARILAVVGSFEAMITKKPYRKALSINAAVKEVRKSSGKQFDPDVVKAFSDAVNRKDVRRLLEKEL